jgi:CHAD domain-containing protein
MPAASLPASHLFHVCNFKSIRNRIVVPTNGVRLMDYVLLSLREARLVRQRASLLLRLHNELLDDTNPDAIHDLRVGSRRMREVLDYLRNSLPEKWFTRLMNASKKITKSLGHLRETEENLKMITDFRDDAKIDAISAEILIHTQKKSLRKGKQKSIRRISESKFATFEKFITRVRGSRITLPTVSDMLEIRMQDFVSFTWNTTINDDHLHDLRIRAKKLRYAMEIHEKITGRRMGRLRSRLKKLQETLGHIHDLFVLSEFVRHAKEEWNDPDSKLVAASLNETYEFVLSQKVALYPRVYPMYSKIVSRMALPTQVDLPEPSPAMVN